MLRKPSLVLGVLLPVAVAAAQPLSTGQWLVAMGRDYPLSAQASVGNADARVTLLFMQAAGRVDRALPEPWYWQADMFAALDLPDRERAALAEYLKRRPDDAVTCLRWIDLCADDLQTSEVRAELYRSVLRDAGRMAREVRSDLHRRLAEFHWNRGERGQAEEQAKAALAEFKMNLAAKRLLDDIQGVQPSPAGRLEWALVGMVLNPAGAMQAQAIGDLLNSWNMPVEAGEWYAQADRLRELALGKQPGMPPPLSSRPAPGSQPAPSEAKAMLAAFPRAVLDYPFNPSKYLSLSWQVPRAELSPGEPWRCTVRIKNVGSFPITFGPEGMLVPDLRCSISTRGDRDRTSGPTLQLSLYRKLRLEPGESIEESTTLDVGPIRASMIGTPQAGQQVEVAGVLSPIRIELADGREAWVPSIGGMAAPALRFRRTAFTATSEHVQTLVRQSQSQTASERIAALELLAMLLAEHQHLAAGRLRYSALPIDPAAVQAAVLARAADDDWQVRARLTECMRWFVLDAQAAQVGAGLLSDSHWLVRGLALRMLADQHRDKLMPVLRRMAAGDSDEWVRNMADALVERIAPATQPQ